MKHTHYLGSTFRNRYSKEPSLSDIEDPLIDSGLLGKNPLSKRIIRTTSINDDSFSDFSDKKTSLYIKPRAKTRIKPDQLISKPIILDASPRRPQTSVGLNSKEEKVKEVPNVFYGSILPPNEPPSPSNFVQLSEMLSRLLESEEIDESDVYSQIFCDLVRQFYIECSEEGVLLNKCRCFFEESQKKIPEIRTTLQSKLDKIQIEIQENQKSQNMLHESITENEKHSNHLVSVVEDMKKDLSLLISKHDQYIKAISVSSHEANDLKRNLDQLGQNISMKSKKLAELNEQLRSLDVIGAQYTADTLRFTENIRSIRKQQESGKAKLASSSYEIQSAKGSIAILDREIQAMTLELEKAQAVPEHFNIDTQTDLISKKAISTGSGQKIEREQSRKEITGTLFERICQEHALLCGKEQARPLQALTYDEFYKLKSIIVSHETEFRMSKDDINMANKGEFVLHSDNHDYIRLFASKLTSDIMDRAVARTPKSSIVSQTLSKSNQKEADTTQGPKIKEKTRFISMLISDYSMRNPKRFDWLLTNIRTLYDEKAVENEKLIAEGAVLLPFPEFILAFSKKRYVLDFVSDQFCWDIHISANEHIDRTLEAEMFSGFLNEKYNAEQLAFYLRCRADCIKIGCSVTVRTRDQLETFNEYYLSQDQLESILPSWWEERYQKSLLQEILEYSVARPAIHLESTKRYIAMHDVLNVCINAYEKDTISRLNELLLSYRIVPRINIIKFNELMLSLIPVLTPKQIEDFYRSAVTKSKHRLEISKDKFIKMFQSSCFVRRDRKKEMKKAAKKVEQTHESVSHAWFEKKSHLMMIMDYFVVQSSLQPDNLTLKAYLEDAQRYLSMLNHSLSTGDGDLSCLHYYRLLFTLDILYSAVRPMDPEFFQPSLVSLECAIREGWLDSVFTDK